MGEIVDVEITAPDAAWLADFTRTLITDGLAASGNISPVRSIYRWDNIVEDRPEYRVVLHTHRNRVLDIIDRTIAEHPYQIPGLRVTTVETYPAYAAWVTESTSRPQ